MGTRGPLTKASYKGITYETGRPDAPSWLAEDARIEYDRAAGLMGDTLTLADMATLAVYAEAYADFGTLTQEIRREGVVTTLNNKMLASNPKCAQRDAAAKRMQAAAAKLGFSPVDRARVPATASREQSDPFSKFVK